MKDFFTFYTDIQTMELPFVAFGLTHLLFLFFSAAAIFFLYRYYCTLQEGGRMRFQKVMGVYFLLEEAVYLIWLLMVCHDEVWRQALPLELCSLCAYMGALAAFTQKKSFCFFSAVTGLFAGLIAMVYPANISQLYPALSYRTINFYMMHGSFVLFALLQLKKKELLTWRNTWQNLLLVSAMFALAFVVNLFLDTQFMFVGIPPKLPPIRLVYELTGIVLFLPVVFLFLGLVQAAEVFLLRKLLLNKR